MASDSGADDAAALRERVAALEETVAEQQATSESPEQPTASRRGFVKAAAAVAGLGALGIYSSYPVSAQAAGQIGSASSPVDVEVYDLNVQNGATLGGDLDAGGNNLTSVGAIDVDSATIKQSVSIDVAAGNSIQTAIENAPIADNSTGLKVNLEASTYNQSVDLTDSSINRIWFNGSGDGSTIITDNGSPPIRLDGVSEALITDMEIQGGSYPAVRSNHTTTIRIDNCSIDANNRTIRVNNNVTLIIESNTTVRAVDSNGVPSGNAIYAFGGSVVRVRGVIVGGNNSISDLEGAILSWAGGVVFVSPAAVIRGTSGTNAGQLINARDNVHVKTEDGTFEHASAMIRPRNMVAAKIAGTPTLNSVSNYIRLPSGALFNTPDGDALVPPKNTSTPTGLPSMVAGPEGMLHVETTNNRLEFYDRGTGTWEIIGGT